MTQEQIRAHFEQVKKVFGPEKHKAIPMFEDFRPYMYALTVAPGMAPKGAVVVIPGGDHGGFP